MVFNWTLCATSKAKQGFDAHLLTEQTFGLFFLQKRHKYEHTKKYDYACVCASHVVKVMIEDAKYVHAERYYKVVGYRANRSEVCPDNLLQRNRSPPEP